MAYLTVHEVAEMLKSHTNTVYKMCRQGVLPAVKIGKEWRIDSDKFLKFMEHGVRKAPEVPLQGVIRHALAGGHLLGLFSDEEAVWEFEQAFFLAAPKTRSRLLKACWWQNPDVVRRRLTEGGIPIQRLEAEGTLLILDLGRAFERHGPVGAAGAWFKVITASLSAGYERLWGSGCPTFDCCGCREGLVEFEAALDQMLRGLPVTGVCSYVLPRDWPHDLTLILELIATHDRFFIRSDQRELVAQVAPL
jgi:excisionase family DNA binding protein